MWLELAYETLAPFWNEQVIGGLNRVVDDNNADTGGVGMSSIEQVPAAPKAEHSDEDSFSESSPELDEHSFVQEVTQIQKRKGGRKPVRNDVEVLLYHRGPDATIDLCNVRGTEAEEPSSASSVSRTSDGVYQAARNDH